MAVSGSSGVLPAAAKADVPGLNRGAAASAGVLESRLEAPAVSAPSAGCCLSAVL